MNGEDIKLDKAQRARAVALEPQVIDDPEWACAAIIWQRDQLADRDAEIERLSIENEKWRLCREFIPSEKQEMLAEIERLNTAFDRVQRASEFVVAEDGRRIYDLTVEIERLRADLVWAVQNAAGAGPCVIQWGDGPPFNVARHDGTSGSICRAVREARDGD